MPWAAIGAIGSLGGGIASLIGEQDANSRAQAAQDKAFQQYMALAIPDPAQQKIAMQMYVSQGKLDPRLETVIKQDPSAFEKIVTDSNTKSAQSRALQQLQDDANSGGMNLQDKAKLQEALITNQAHARAEQQGIAAQMAQRGLGGSGFDVAAKLQGQQSSQDAQAKSGLQAAADAQNRALQAIQSSGQLAGQMQAADYSQQAQRAAAADRINQFNTQNAQSVAGRNVDTQNAADKYNLDRQQQIANANVDLGNKQDIYNTGLIQQQYDNKLKQTAGATGQLDKMANTAAQSGQAASNFASNIGSGISQGASALDDYFKKKAPQGVQVS